MRKTSQDKLLPRSAGANRAVNSYSPAARGLAAAALLSLASLAAPSSAADSTRGAAPESAEPLRLWTDVTGRFHREARIVEVLADRVRFLLADGRRIMIPWDKLSPADREYAEAFGQRTAASATDDVAATAAEPLVAKPLTEESLAAEPPAAENPVAEPSAAEPAIAERVWTDASGTRRARGTLVAVRGDELIVLKPSGRHALATLAQLSPGDRAYVQALLASAQVRTALAEGWASADVPSENAAPIPTASPRPVDKKSDIENSVLAEGAAGLRARLTSGLPLSSTPVWQQQSTPAEVVLVRASRRFLEHYVNQQVEVTQSVSDVVVGTPSHGTSHTRGQSQLLLVPSQRQAVADILFAGDSTANTVSDARRTQVSSVSHTNFSARKRIVLDQSGVHASPTASTAASSTQTCGVCTSLPGLRGRLAQRIAAREAAASRGQVDAEVASHFQVRLNRHMDQDLRGPLAGLDRLQRQLFAAAASGGLELRAECRTTSGELEIALFRASAATGGDAAPPAIPGDPPAAIWIHGSLVQQVMAEEKLRDALMQLAEKLAAETKSFVAGGKSKSLPVWEVGWTQDGSWLTVTLDLPGKRPAADGAATVRSASSRTRSGQN